MKFVDKLLSLLSKFGKVIIDAVLALVNFLAKPLAYILAFIEAIFYFFEKLFQIVVQIVMIFVAMFQFLFSLFAGIVRTAIKWLSVNPNPNDVHFPSSTYKGFEVVINLIQPTGLLTVVPIIALGLLWLFFILKMIGLFGGSITIRPFGG